MSHLILIPEKMTASVEGVTANLCTLPKDIIIHVSNYLKDNSIKYLYNLYISSQYFYKELGPEIAGMLTKLKKKEHIKISLHQKQPTLE